MGCWLYQIVPLSGENNPTHYKDVTTTMIHHLDRSKCFFSDPWFKFVILPGSQKIKRPRFWDVKCETELQPLIHQVIHQQRMAADVFAISLGLGEAEQRGLQVRYFSFPVECSMFGNRCATPQMNSDFFKDSGKP